MKLMKQLDLRYVKHVLAASVASACWLQPALAAEVSDVTVDPEAAAHESWSQAMIENNVSPEGCFHAAYPSLVWEKVECKVGQPGVHPVRKPSALHNDATGGGDVTGDGKDYVASATGLITKTVGSFPAVTGVKSEKSVGVASFGGGGILGPNEYTLQINTDFNSSTSACQGGKSTCVVWQQFIYSPDYRTKGEAAVFMQYWLIYWGTSRCPTGWTSDGGGDCYRNSAYVTAPDQKITTLQNLTISGSATAGGNDTVVFGNGTNVYSVSGKDSVVDISSVWKQSEFNIVGNAGGSRANFNTGSSVTVKAALTDGSTSAPACVANEGTTGESNNLTLGACSVGGGTSPYIQFTEKN